MIKLKESLLEQILEHVTEMELQDFVVTGGHIANPKLGELRHSSEIIAESMKYSKRDADKAKFCITLELELQEK